MRRTPVIVSLSLALALVGGAAAAAEFSPTADFGLTNTDVRGNPQLFILVEQDRGEEELKSVRLRFPAGFKLARDPALENGERLGSGRITIDAGPRCSGDAPLSAPVTVHVSIVERDRTEQERNQGVKAVYVVDLEPVTTIDLLVRGSVRRGWTLSGKIPANDFTCPPFRFMASIDRRAAESNTRIIQNPASPGRYTLSITFHGLDGSDRTVRERFRISR